MSVEKRMMIAVAVSFVIIVLWSMYIVPPKPPVTESADDQAAADISDEQQSDEQQSDEQAVEEGETPAEPGIDEQEEFELTAAEGVQEVVVESDIYRVVLTNESGGSATHWWLTADGGKKYIASFSDETLDLVAPELLRREGFQPFATMVREGKGEYSPLPALPVINAQISDGKVDFDEDGKAEVSFILNDENFGLMVKRLTFYRDSYQVDVDLTSEIKGRSNRETIMMLGPGVGELLKGDSENGFQPGAEGNSYIRRKEGQAPVHVPAFIKAVGKPEEGSPSFVETSGNDLLIWAGLENNYFMTLAFGIGDQDSARFQIYELASPTALKSGEEDKYFVLPYLALKPNKDAVTFKLYIGPKDLKRLETDAGGRLKDVVSFGWFSFISRPALWLLQQINTFTSNYGFSIIVLTVMINILLLPLIVKQRMSMQAMQKLQPMIKQIQAKYKVERGDDIKLRQHKKQKLNEETMALYRAEGVNPMGGCLPLLIQLPILLALFDMFRAAIELRKAPFMLWWQNLATADTTYILPILMGVTMYMSQKMTPAPVESQSGAMKILPFILVFIFASAPSGLVLYWLTSSLFNLGTQVVLSSGKVFGGKGRKPESGKKAVKASAVSSKKGKKKSRR